MQEWTRRTLLTGGHVPSGERDADFVKLGWGGTSGVVVLFCLRVAHGSRWGVCRAAGGASKPKGL